MKRALLIFGLFCLPLPALAATDIQEVKTASGITAWLVEEHALPLVSAKIGFKDAGFAEDPAGKEGRAGMLAAMLMEGAGAEDALAFSKRLESKAISLSYSADEDNFYGSLACLSKFKHDGFHALSESLLTPRMDPDALTRVRSQAASVLKRQQGEPNYLMYRAWQQAAYPNHPYSKPVLGTEASLAALSKQDLNFARAHYLAKDNLIVAVVGDITAAELKPLLEQSFSNLPAKAEREQTIAEAPVFQAQKTPIVIPYTMPQTMVTFGGQGIKRSDPNFIPAFVLNHLLGGGSLTAILGLEIREKRGLAYAINSGLESYLHGARWKGAFATRNEEAGNAVKALKETLGNFAKVGPSAKELNDAKTYLTGSFVLNLDSNEDVANFLLTMQLHSLGIDYLKKRNAMVSAVSKEQIMQVAHKLVMPDSLQLILIGQPKLP